MINKNIVIENARIMFRNFSGEEKRFNPVGRRNFCVFLETDLGKVLEEDGWNIKWLEPRDEDEDGEPQPYMQVTVSFDHVPPKIVLISGTVNTLLDDSTIDVLDNAEIANVDLIIRPYNWEVNGKTGVKAYVKSMYVTLEDDEFSEKYDALPF